jgi:hypothetical protein
MKKSGLRRSFSLSGRNFRRACAGQPQADGSIARRYAAKRPVMNRPFYKTNVPLLITSWRR